MSSTGRCLSHEAVADDPVGFCRYVSTPVFPGHDKDAKRVREKLNKQRQNAAKAVVSQHARISGADRLCQHQ